MVRSCLTWLKQLAYPVVFLALLACLTEIGLRVYDSVTGQITRADLYDRGMVCKSWFTHHTLKPSRAFAVRNPDTNAQIRVSISGMGLRGSELVIPRPEKTFRVICLGDETTLAANIEESKTFCSRLQQLLQEGRADTIEVVNAGVPEYCPLLSCLQLRHQLLGLEPNVVVLNFDTSDVADDYRFRRFAVISDAGAPLSCAHPSLAMKQPAGQSKLERSLLLPEWSRQQIGRILSQWSPEENSEAIDEPMGRYRWLEDDPPDWSIHVRQTLDPIAHIQTLLAGSGIPLIVAACPAPWQVSAAASSGPGVRARAGVAQHAHYRSRKSASRILPGTKDSVLRHARYVSADSRTRAAVPEERAAPFRRRARPLRPRTGPAYREGFRLQRLGRIASKSRRPARGAAGPGARTRKFQGKWQGKQHGKNCRKPSKSARFFTANAEIERRVKQEPIQKP
jgi:hypothetical protein